MKNAREAAFLAILASVKHNQFIADYLEEWRRQTSPEGRDYNLARQIAYGATQRALTLDYMAAQLSDKKKVSLKVSERVLLRVALYQIAFLERIPIYATVDETLKIAKKHFHRNFVGFLNAILRKAANGLPELPSEEFVSNLSVLYSYPEYFVQALIHHYGSEIAKKIMHAQNQPAPVMARVRTTTTKHGFALACQEPVIVAIIPEAELSSTGASEDYYIQNATPAVLIGNLAKQINFEPKRILDLCASPGGKLIATHDVFPKAKLYANDVSPEKLKVLNENCIKYGLDVQISCGLGEMFASPERFDLIILDVPCSNTGVLNKRPEARWRLSQENTMSLGMIQKKLITHAVEQLLAHKGQLWYMTCSILPEENEQIVAWACETFGLNILFQQSILPSSDGWDGGYACALGYSS